MTKIVLDAKIDRFATLASGVFPGHICPLGQINFATGFLLFPVGRYPGLGSSRFSPCGQKYPGAQGPFGMERPRSAQKLPPVQSVHFSSALFVPGLKVPTSHKCAEEEPAYKVISNINYKVLNRYVLNTLKLSIN